MAREQLSGPADRLLAFMVDEVTDEDESEVRGRLVNVHGERFEQVRAT
jgi:hypothetical protein